ncbi:MAG: PKD domain-containing protein [Solirubrobacterales bacterium]
MGPGKIVTAVTFVSLFVCMCSETVEAYNPKFFTLNIGQTCTDSFGGAVARSVKLLEVVDSYEMGYWQGGLRRICYKSVITLAVDGVEGSVGCGPFQMPVVVNGVRICGELTRAFTIDSTAIPEMSEAVLLSAKDASMPWCDPGRFAFPIKDYRWGCANFQNAWLGFHDMSNSKLYYHYGVDLGGMYPKHHKLVSMIPNAEVLSYGVGTSIRDSELDILYYHMVDGWLRKDIGVGSVLDRGEMFGYLGNSQCGNDAHVHIDMRYVSDPKRNINCFPILVQAYFEEYDEPLSFPGHKRHCYEGDTIELEGALSVAPPGRSIVSYEWTFTDGATATAANVRRTYGTRGAYAEELTVTDSAGKRSSNYVMVFVYDRRNPTDAPYADSLSHFPVRGIAAGTPVTIYFHGRNMDSNLSIDYGDGVIEPASQHDTKVHSYSRPGEYTITYKGDGPGGTGIFRRKIVVGGE